MTHFQRSIGDTKQSDHKKQENPETDVFEEIQGVWHNYQQI